MDTWTVKRIREYCTEEGIRAPSGLRKAELISYINGVLAERQVTTQAEENASGQRTVAEIEKIYPVSYDDSLHYIDHLNKYGWSIVPIPGWEEYDFVSMFFDFLETTSRECGLSFDRNRRYTWLGKNIPVTLHGIFKHYVGHTEFCWKIRELCADIFAELYGIDKEDLICSFDGANFSMPKSSSSLRQWFHVDQPRKEFFQGEQFCQGVVNFLDSGEKDGGLVLLENSHLDYRGYLERHPSYGYTWEPVDMTDEALTQRRVVKVCAPAGHLILFDSNTVHCNSHPTSENFRMCTYVSMQPRCKATKKELEKAIKLYEEGRMTGHSRYGTYFIANAKDPRSYGKTLVKPSKVEIAELNELRSRLVGY